MIDPYEVIRRALESDVVRVTMGNGARVDVLTGAFCGLCIRSGIHDAAGAVKCGCWCHEARAALRERNEPDIGVWLRENALNPDEALRQWKIPGSVIMVKSGSLASLSGEDTAPSPPRRGWPKGKPRKPGNDAGDDAKPLVSPEFFKP